MADNRIVYKIEVHSEQGTASVRDLKGQFIAVQVPLDKLNEKLQGYKVNLASISGATNQVASSVSKFNTQIDGSTAATGGATSAALELGRVVSDLPYGIRGVANNLSQFASNMVFAARSAGGLTAALKSLWTALSGPLGLLLAIQGIIAALDHFSQSTSKAKKEATEFNKAISSTTGSVAKLEMLKEVLDDSNASMNEQENALSLLKKMGYDPLNESLEDFIENQKKLLVLKATSKVLEEELRKVAESMMEVQNLQESLTKDFKENIKELSDDPNSFAAGLRKAFSNIFPKKELDLMIDAVKLDKIPDVLDELEDKLKKKSDKFKENYRKILSLLGEGSDKGKRPLATPFDFSDIDPKEIEKRAKAIREALEKTFGKPVVGILDDENVEIPEHWKERIRKYQEELDKEITEKLKREYRKEDIETSLELFKSAYSSVNDFLSSEFDRQMTIEQNKTNALNEELNNRLLNEELSKEERKKIQNQIWQNDEALRKRQEKIERKKFNQQKAFNIAMATVDTYRAANGVLADTKGGSFARIAGMIAVISTGLLNVASIARQKFQSSSASTPINVGSGGGSSGDGNSRSFNFNLVGGERENQLLGAIQSQFNNPLKAYVVSRDVTNQQQLDSDIQGTAGF